MSKPPFKLTSLLPTRLCMMTTNTNAVQVALDFDAESQHLKHVTDASGAPVTCIILRDQRRTYRKTLITRANFENIRQSAQTTHSNGVPQALLDAATVEADAIGANTMFAVGSLAKVALALVYCIVIEKKSFKNLTWDTRIVSWMKELQLNPVFIFDDPDGGIGMNLTVKDILLHHKALPHINRFLFLPDGTFQATDEDFLTHIGGVAYETIRILQERGSFDYSNANYILMALLLEKQTGWTIDRIMRKYLFDHLNMRRTTLASDEIDRANYAIGQRITSELKTYPAKLEQRYAGSTAYKMTVGMWSCTNDLAKLYDAIFEARAGIHGYITPSMVDTLLETHLYKDELAGVSLAGRVVCLQAQDPGDESLNHIVQALKRPDSPTQRSGSPTRVPRDRPNLFYKSATCDGNTSTIYSLPGDQVYAVVLSNASGPLDVTEPIAGYLLRLAMYYRENCDANSFRQYFQMRTKQQLTLSVKLWSRLEAEDKDLTVWSDNVRPYVGVYRHKTHGLEIEIKAGGQATFSRRREQGVRDVLSTMTIRASRNTRHRLRLFSVRQGQQPGFFIDRLTNLGPELDVQRSSTGRSMLVSVATTHVYPHVKDVYVQL